MREAGARTLAVSGRRFLLARILYPLRHRRGLFICLKLGGRIKAQEDTSVDAWGCFFLGGAGGRREWDDTPCNMLPFPLPAFKRTNKIVKGSSGQANLALTSG